MLDLIDFKRKVIYRFTTDIQSAVEHFCVSVIGYHYGKNGAVFSHPADTFGVIKRSYEGRKPDKFLVTIVKTTVGKRGYKYEISDHIQRSLG